MRIKDKINTYFGTIIDSTNKELINLKCKCDIYKDRIKIKVKYSASLEYNYEYYFSEYLVIRREGESVIYLTVKHPKMFNELRIDFSYRDAIHIENTYTDYLKTLLTFKGIDELSGYEFELYLMQFFLGKGYKVKQTKRSNDQGVDLFIGKSGKKIAVQAKRYSNNVTNKSVQEIIAGTKFYNCDQGVVITNSYFTKSALSLAKIANVILWDRDVLLSMLQKTGDEDLF
ncbi:restriction endonuclease [Priestia megaterium]